MPFRDIEASQADVIAYMRLRALSFDVPDTTAPSREQRNMSPSKMVDAHCLHLEIFSDLDVVVRWRWYTIAKWSLPV